MDLNQVLLFPKRLVCRLMLPVAIGLCYCPVTPNCSLWQQHKATVSQSKNTCIDQSTHKNMALAEHNIFFEFINNSLSKSAKEGA